MISHTIFIKFDSKTAPLERDAVFQALIALCDRVGAVTSSACGPDVDPRSRAEGCTHAFSVVFGAKEAREAFQELPEYATALDWLSRVAETVRLAE